MPTAIPKKMRPSTAMPGLMAFALVAIACCHRSESSTEPTGFEITVLDAHNDPVPCRIHLRDANGRIWKSGAWPSFDDHFVYVGTAMFPLQPGSYAYEVERGSEYQRLRGSFQVAEKGTKVLRLRIERIADLGQDGWYSGDLHIHRRPEDVTLLMRAEDIRVGPVVTWWNGSNPYIEASAQGPVRFDGDRWMDATAGEDERQGGAVLYFRLAKPLTLPPPMRDDKGEITHRQGDERDEYPAAASFARTARAQVGAHIDIEKPFWWDMPTWIALDLADSVGIAHNHMTRASLHNGEAWGKPRDPKIYGDDPGGDGYWTQDIYYQILNAGIRLAPSAGSASGVLPNPVGYNRVYVHLDGPFDYDAWWGGLQAGHSFVTNGPILLVSANGKLPGHVFETNAAKLDIALETRVFSNEGVGRVELVRDGHIVQRGSHHADGGAISFAPVRFEQSGWFLVSTIADRNDKFRF